MSPTFYPYRDASSKLLFRVVRHHDDPKRFTYESLTGKELTASPARTVLYRLPELLAADPRLPVYVTEGEKDADRLADLGLLATTNPGGCHVGWKPEYTPALRGRHVVILRDNDKPGIRHAEKVNAALRGVAASVLLFPLPRLGRAEDVSDWLDFRGGTADELQRIVGKRRTLQQNGAVPATKGGHPKRDLVFRSRTLSTTEKLLLLAVQHRENSPEAPTAAALAEACGLKHRVSAQRLISGLIGRSLLERRESRLCICWGVVAAEG